MIDSGYGYFLFWLSPTLLGQAMNGIWR